MTRFATAHLVKQQDQINSCGIACILMVNFKLKKGLMAAGMAAGAAFSVVPIPGASYVGLTMSQQAKNLALKTEPEVYKVYGDIVGSVYDGTSYTDALNHPAVLAKLGLGSWECFWAGPNAMATAIKDAIKGGAPCIVHVKWASGGAHFVCVDDVVGAFGTDYATVNDPGDADVYVTSIADGGPVSYRDNTGSFSGWIVRRK